MLFKDVSIAGVDFFVMYKEKSAIFYNSSKGSAKELERAYQELMLNSHTIDLFFLGNLKALLKKYKNYIFEPNEVKADLISISYREGFSSQEYREIESSFFYLMSCGKKDKQIKAEIRCLDKFLSYALEDEITSITCACIDMEKAKFAKDRLDDFCIFFDENNFSCYKLINKKIRLYKDGNKFISEGFELINAHNAALGNLKIMNSLKEDFLLKK